MNNKIHFSTRIQLLIAHFLECKLMSLKNKTVMMNIFVFIFYTLLVYYKLTKVVIRSFNFIIFVLWGRFTYTIPVMLSLAFSGCFPLFNLKIGIITIWFKARHMIKFFFIFLIFAVFFKRIYTWHHMLQTVSSMHLACLAPSSAPVHTHSFALVSQSPEMYNNIIVRKYLEKIMIKLS